MGQKEEPYSDLLLDGTDLYAVTVNGGVYKSGDGGNTWSLTGADIVGNEANSIIKAGSTILVGSDQGAYVTSNAGTSWSFSNTGFAFSDVSQLLVSATDIYAATPNGVYISGNDGVNWSGVGLIDLSSDIESVAINGATLWAGTDALYKSTNSGVNWVEVTNVGFTATSINFVYVSGSNTLVQSTAQEGIKYTPDGGTTWNAVTGVSEMITTISDNGGTLYAGTIGGGIYTSTDDGTTWSSFSNTGLDNDIITRLIFNGTTWYAGTGGGVYKSTDSGANWTKMVTGMKAHTVNALVTDGSDVYGGTAGGGIFKSSNGGSSWIPVNSGITGKNYMVFSLLKSGTDIYAGTFGGVVKTSNSGTSWVQKNTGLAFTFGGRSMVSAGANLFVLDFLSTIYTSSDGGDNWNAAMGSGGNTFSGLPWSIGSDGVNIYGSGFFGDVVMKSTDAGTNWISANSGITNGVFNVSTQFFYDGSSVYAATAEGMFRTDDNGTSWVSAGTGLPSDLVNAFAIDGSNLYAGTEGSGAYVTSSQGASWAAANTDLGNQLITSLAAGSLYAGTKGSGVWSYSAPAPGVPNQPLEVTFSSTTTTSATINWAAPFDNGSAITGYSLEQKEDGGVYAEIYAGANTTFDVSSLIEGTTYYFKVKATNAVGDSPFSTEASFTPSNIIIISNGSTSTCSGSFVDTGGSSGGYQNNEDLTFTVSPAIANNKVSVSFTSFSLENNFDFLYIYDGATIGDPLLATLTGSTIPSDVVATTTGGELTFKFTSDGSGTDLGWNATFNCVPPGPPIQPLEVVFSSTTSTSATVNWAAPFDNGSAITGYSLEQKEDGGVYAEIYAGANTTFDVSSLIEGTTYYFKVKATNAVGDSPFSTEASFTPSNIIIISNGSTSTCSGNFVDTGGSAGNYQNSEDLTFTVSPGIATDKVSVSFNSFGLEDTYDYLYVYDGATTGDPLLATLTGAAIPTDIIATSAGGELTFNFTSDVSNVDLGWDATFTCVPPPVTTSGATAITATSATLNGTVNSDGGATITERGFVYSLTSVDATPTVAESSGSDVTKVVVSGTIGAFGQLIIGLTVSTSYSFAAYATNSLGTAEGSVLTFTPINAAPTFTSTPITSIEAGNTYTYTITTDDADGDNVILTAPMKPAWLSLVTDVVGDVVTTFAGSGSSGNTDANGTSASFSYPQGVAVDASGNLYVADLGNNKIRKVASNGDVITLAGSGSQGSTNGNGVNASFYSPRGVAVDGSGNVYVADLSNNRIRKIAPNGDVTTLGASASFHNPQGVAVDASGNVFVADGSNHLIRKIAPNDDVTTLAGSGSEGSTNANGTSASFSTPFGVAIDASGNVYVTDRGNNKIRKIAPNGDVTTFAGSGSTGSTNGNGTSASFNAPAGIAVDAYDNVYVADYGNNIIRKITPNGDVTTLVGSGSAGSTDANGASASFNGPGGVAVDASGNVYVADNLNHKIRKVSGVSVALTGDATGNVGSHPVVLEANDGNGGATQQSFTILVSDVPSVTSSAASAITANLATLNGDITSDGEAAITERGFVYSLTATDATPTVAESSGSNVTKVVVAGTIGAFSKALASLTAATSYSFAAYATNSLGTTEGSVLTFTTSALTTPTITFVAINKIYGDADFTLDATSNSAGIITYSIVGVANGTSVSGTNNEDVTLGNAGAVTIRATQVADGIYSSTTKDIILTIATKAITVTADASQTKSFGDADPTFTYTLTTGALETGDSFTGSLSRAAGEDIGTYAITVGTLSAGVNYNMTFVGADFTITTSTPDVPGSGIDADGDGFYTWYVDADSDGYGINDTFLSSESTPAVGRAATNDDCDDTNAAINPNTIWYLDSDGDGFGNINNTIAACTAPVGYVVDNTDCDDANGAINPNTKWYLDSDSDGYGGNYLNEVSSDNTLQIFTGCQPPSTSYLSTNTDCDDTDATVNPDVVWYADTDGDGHGDAANTTTGCTQPTGFVASSDDCLDTDADVYPTAPALADGKDNDCDGAIDKVSQTITFEPLANVEDGSGDINLVASSTSQLAVSFAVKGPATVDGATLTITGAGSITVTASQVGDDGYLAADEVVQSFCINPVPEATFVFNGATAVTLTSNYAEGNQWFMNDASISGATNQEYDPNQGGMFFVEVTIDGCQGVSNTIDLILTEIENNTFDNSLNIYPMPVSSTLTIDTKNLPSGEYTIRMVDMLGKSKMDKRISIQENSSKAINVNELPQGTYTLILMHGEDVFVQKVIKK